MEKHEKQCSEFIEVNFFKIVVQKYNKCSSLFSVGLIKYKSQFEKWNSRKFLAEAEEAYKDMNDAFAR